MSLINLRAVMAALVCATALGAMAVPAKPGIITMSQPDGTDLNVRLIGDERSHYTLSEDGYLLMSVNEVMHYATISADGTITASAIPATNAGERPATARAFLTAIDKDAQAKALERRDASVRPKVYPMGPGLFPGTPFPAYGKQKGLVILVEYADEYFRLADPYDYFNRLLNEPGFSDYGGTGSAVDYFKESSCGMFEPQFDLYGPVRLDKNMSYYGGNGPFGGDLHAERMAIEACQLLDDDVDFSQYDRDGDGIIDNVFIFYAGRGEATGGGSNTVWPHSWNIMAATDEPFIFDGVRLDRYACSNEWASGRPDGVGTFIHEFSHVMGLPDLYATSYNGSFTPGAWSAMDVGPYNNNGMTPPLFSAFERYALGWIEPTELKAGMNVTMPSIGSNVCGIVKTSSENEYFLFENRQRTSWDTFIPGHGMLVWHIDYVPALWTANVVNNTPTHQYVDLIEADGIPWETSRDADCFPGEAGITSFTSDGTPSFKTWDNTPIDLPLTEITEQDNLITFKVAGGREGTLPTTVTLAAGDVTSKSFSANWEAREGAESYLLSVRALDGAGEQVLKDYNVGNRTTYKVEGLSASTKYEYTVCVGTPLEHSSASNAMEVTTGESTLDELRPVLADASDVTATSFTANWEALPTANDYIVSIYEKIVGEPQVMDCDFTDGVSNLPAGWRATTTESYTNSSYSGAAVPAMKMDANGDYITSCLYKEPVSKISFWHRGSTGTNSSDCINVYVKIDLTWQKVGTYPVVTTSGGQTNTIEELPEGVNQVRIEYERKSTKGMVAIDDIRIEWGLPVETSAVVGYETPVHTGNVESYTFTGLKPSTLYTYSLTATDGTLNSIASRYKDTKTAEGVGIKELDSHSQNFQVTGRIVKAHGAVSIYDVSGRRIASLGAGNSTMLAPGVYLVRSTSGTGKIIIR